MEKSEAIYFGKREFSDVIRVVFDGVVTNVIAGVEDYMLRNDLNFVEVRIVESHTVDEFIRAGFMPTVISDNTKQIFQFETWMLIDHYIDRFEPESLEFWFEEIGDIENLIGGRSRMHYYYANIKGWMNFAAKTSISFPLLMYAKDQVYSSRRAKTDMLMFRQATSGLYNRISDNQGIVKLVIGDSFSMNGLPVTRYASGMSKGLYYDDDINKSSFCGTFYYVEPESTTYLTFSTYAIYRNKHEAIADLVSKSDVADFTDPIVDRYYNAPERFPDLSLMMTPSEYSKIIFRETIEEFDKPYYWEKVPTRQHYVGRHLNLYAVEDEYDQDLCKVAREAELDVVILTHMVGAFQLVTEVLDTRERLTSFSNLTFPNA